jgi:hypothetical protein
VQRRQKINHLYYFYTDYKANAFILDKQKLQATRVILMAQIRKRALNADKRLIFLFFTITHKIYKKI